MQAFSYLKSSSRGLKKKTTVIVSNIFTLEIFYSYIRILISTFMYMFACAYIFFLLFYLYHNPKRKELTNFR